MTDKLRGSGQFWCWEFPLDCESLDDVLWPTVVVSLEELKEMYQSSKGDRMTEPKHSPLPFKMHRMGEFDETVILDNGGGGVARVSGKPDAEFILRAVNAHKDMLVALGKLADMYQILLETSGIYTEKSTRALSAARAAIAKAEGRTA